MMYFRDHVDRLVEKLEPKFRGDKRDLHSMVFNALQSVVRDQRQVCVEAVEPYVRTGIQRETVTKAIKCASF